MSAGDKESVYLTSAETEEKFGLQILLDLELPYLETESLLKDFTAAASIAYFLRKKKGPFMQGASSQYFLCYLHIQQRFLSFFSVLTFEKLLDILMHCDKAGQGLISVFYGKSLNKTPEMLLSANI